MKSTKVLLILGTRSQIIEFAPLINIAKKDSDINTQKRQEKSDSFGDEKASAKTLNVLKEPHPCPLER